jgi:nucleoside-diphosphate-sugar epimerase
VSRGLDSAFVTGGSGFIGGRLLGRLRDDGVAVRALARSEGSGAKVMELGAEPVRGDLDDPAAMATGAAGCDVTFHLAAHVADWGKPEEFERGNVRGTRNALEASRRAGVRRFVHCGTEAAILAGQALDGADETEPLRPDSPALYSATKAKAEALVREANGDGLETVVVRPRFVWGAGDTTLLPEIAAAVEAGRFAWVGGGTNRTSITHVDNVVEGLLCAAERGAGGEAYFVTDGDPVVFREFISELLRTQGIEPPDRTIPTWVASAIARGGELAWRALPLRGSPPLTRFALWAASLDCVLDDSKARGKLGYAPVISRAEGLEGLRQAVSRG